MKWRILILLLCLFSLVSYVNTQTTVKEPTVGIVNGRALFLPKPDYPQEVKDLCAEGKVELEVLIGEDGRVSEAKAVSGDELLYEYAVRAVRGARFQKTPWPLVKTRGVVVYDFTNNIRCIAIGIVNKKAIKLPKPIIHKHARLLHALTVKVRIILDESGNVILAKAETPVHPLIRVPIESAARNAKFHPTNDVGRIRIMGYIVYKIGKNRKVTT